MIIIAEMTVTGRREIIATVQSQDPGPLDAKDHLVHTETIPGTGTVTAILRIDIEMNARPEVTEIRNAGNFVCRTLRNGGLEIQFWKCLFEGNRDHPATNIQIANTATKSRGTEIDQPTDLVSILLYELVEKELIITALDRS